MTASTIPAAEGGADLQHAKAEQGEHTPGPWEIEHTGNAAIVTATRVNIGGKASVKAIRKLAPAKVAVTVFAAGGMPLNEAMANAHLIAAAPELKTFADGVLIYQVEGDEDHVWLRYGGQDIFICKTNTAEGTALLKMEAARRAAITKALGQ